MFCLNSSETFGLNSSETFCLELARFDFSSSLIFGFTFSDVSCLAFTNDFDCLSLTKLGFLTILGFVSTALFEGRLSSKLVCKFSLKL